MKKKSSTYQCLRCRASVPFDFLSLISSMRRRKMSLFCARRRWLIRLLARSWGTWINLRTIRSRIKSFVEDATMTTSHHIYVNITRRRVCRGEEEKNNRNSPFSIARYVFVWCQTTTFSYSSDQSFNKNIPFELHGKWTVNAWACERAISVSFPFRFVSKSNRISWIEID